MSTVAETRRTQIGDEDRREPVGRDLPVRIAEGLPGAAGRTARHLLPGLGLSFAYGDLTNAEALASFALVEIADDQSDPARPRRRAHLVNDAGNLRLTVEYTAFPELGAVLIGGELENVGIRPVGRLRNLRPLEAALDLSGLGSPTVHTIGGGVANGFFPPNAFQLEARRFLSTSKVRHPLRIDSGGTGRSSDRYAPFFFIEDEAGESGLFAALEWSSLWRAEFGRRVSQGAGGGGGVADLPAEDGPPTDEFHFLFGLEDIALTLRPGERFAIPRAVIGFYEGDIAAGRNALRRFVNGWFPRYAGGEPTPPVTFNTGGPLLTEARFRSLIPVCADLGFEWMQIDWGWFIGCVPPADSYHGIGNWEAVDLTRFPSGIRPIADAVRAHGMKYCTWVDPEEAHPTSLFARQHPEWMLYTDEGNNFRQEMGLVNFGLREVQDYFLDLLGRLIEEWGIHKLKWDHNIDPRAYWARHDDPEQRGLLQLNHVRGVWRVWEELTRRYPTLILENCSSGGRRFDLGTFARAHIHHSSDFKYEDDIVRNQISGLNTIMPSYRVISTVTQRGPDAPDTTYLSRFGGILRFQENFVDWPESARERAKRHIAAYKSIRHLLREEFYALFPQPRTQEDWDGWQFHNAETGEGCVLVFRMVGADGERSPRLRGLAPDRNYRFEEPYTGEVFAATGRSLLAEGLPFALDRNSARLLHYHAE